MKNRFCSNSKSPSPPVSPNVSPVHHTFCESLMEENMEMAEVMINKWNSDIPSFAKVTSLFSNRNEAIQFLKCVKDLRKVMHYYISKDSSSEKLSHAHSLMQIAMKRLETEFYQILSTNRTHLDPESISGRSSHVSERSKTSASGSETGSEDEAETVPTSITEVEHISALAMSDLRSIAEIMISSGYGKECVRIYNIIRKSIVDEGLYKVGVERLTPNQVLKMDWEILECKIKHWLHAVKVAVKTLFDGERILCDYVFSASDSIRESCFYEISKEGALSLFSFPELVAKTKKSPEKMFLILDLYNAISQFWPEIEYIFSFESTSIILSQVLSSLARLGDSARSMLTDFETAIQKDSSKPTPGGGIHPLTRYVMNYICFLSDYSGILSDILADWALPVQTSLPDSFFGILDSDGEQSAIGIRFAWLILVLLCKMDGKTEQQKEVPLSYLFLANNLHYVISKIRASNLQYLLGEDWMSKNEVKVTQYVANYERMGWSRVMAALPDPMTEITRHEAKEYFESFNSAFETTYRMQSSWIVSDGKLRDEITVSLCKKLVPAYQFFYEKYRAVFCEERNFQSLVRFSPDDLGNYLSDLFYGTGISGSSSAHSSSRGF